MKTMKQQTINGFKINVIGTPHGQVADIAGFGPVPFEICQLAAGKDAWMRDIKFECGECHDEIRAGEFGEVPGLCPNCSEEFFNCKRCKGTHHPEDPCEEPCPKLGLPPEH